MKTDIQNTSDLRSQNKKRILECMQGADELTKKDIADHVSLSIATVSNLTNQLLEEGLLRQGSAQRSCGGRIPAALCINEAGSYFLSISLITESRVRMALMNLRMERAFEWDGSYASDSYESLLGCVRCGSEELSKRTGMTCVRILGGAAAIPGIFDHQTGTVVNSTIALLEGKRLAEDLESLLGLSISVENESNLMALACFHMEIGRGANDLIFIYVGEGLGVGIAMQQKLISGYRGLGGEISHIPLGKAGFLCHCGNRNCVETELSVKGFIKKYNLIAQKQISEDTTTEEQWHAFTALVSENDPAALRIVDENAALLGTLVSVLVNLLDPEKVVIGGFIEEISHRIQAPVRERLESLVAVHRETSVPVLYTKGYNRLIMAGCGEMAFTHWMP